MARRQALLSSVKEWTPTQDPAARVFMREDLRRSGLVPEDMHVEPVEHINYPNIPAYIIHYGDTGYWRIRLKFPPELERIRGKYRGPSRTSIRAYIPRRLTQAAIRRPSVKYICEGEKKAEKLFKDLEVPVAAIAGCWSWASKSANGDRILIPTIQELLKPEDTVFYVADRDILNPLKLDIGKAAKALQMKLASLNVICKVLIPPDPYKGIDDWLVDGEEPFVLDDLEEFQFNWFPVPALIDLGVSFRADKDGNITSHKQAHPNLRNTKIFAELILKGDSFIANDKYVGYMVDGSQTSAKHASRMMEDAVNQYFPGFTPHKDGIQAAIEEHLKNLPQTNIIADYISTLKWDGTKRLELWLPQVMELANKDDKDYAQRVGRAMMCGLYQRIIEPGSQCDFMWILHGPQGIGKTTFFRTLGKFPGHDGYSAVAANDIVRMDYTMGRNIKKAIVLDIDDLESVRGKAHGDVKSFVSRTKDTWREIYVSFITEEPRGCILTGSTNDIALLTDMTGSRRFLILSIADIRGVKGFVKWSEQLRDMLLAECAARWAELKDKWWDILPEEINKHNREFVVGSPLIEGIRRMWEEDMLLDYKGQKLITPTALCTFMDDVKWSSPTAIGMTLNRLINNSALDVKVDKKIQIRITNVFLDSIPKKLQSLYKPRIPVQAMWFYPINISE